MHSVCLCIYCTGCFKDFHIHSCPSHIVLIFPLSWDILNPVRVCGPACWLVMKCLSFTRNNPTGVVIQLQHPPASHPRLGHRASLLCIGDWSRDEACVLQGEGSFTIDTGRWQPEADDAPNVCMVYCRSLGSSDKPRK